jgi:ABC-type bacteriocin/lantibiotic exporter with double-glycine peptidase domain
MASPLLAVFVLVLAAAPGNGNSPQAPDADLRCGGLCLYVALNALDHRVPGYAELEAKLGPPTPQGYSMERLAEVARQYGVYALGVETTLDALRDRPGRFACIAYLDQGHFVNIYDIEGNQVYLIDPPGHRAASTDAFRTVWKGRALLIANEPISVDVARRRRWWPIVVGGAGAAAVVGFFARKGWRANHAA